MIDKLNELVGKIFNYKGNNIKIKNVKVISGTYVVLTDKRTYNFFENEVGVFISELMPYEDKIKQYFEKQMIPVEPMVNLPKHEIKPSEMEEKPKNIAPIQGDNLKEILLDTIAKVQADKGYIGQANAICNVVTQMINVKKLELQLNNNSK